jgi:uncharacterized membrane protein
MGAALGLAFAFVVLLMPNDGVSAIIDGSWNARSMFLTFVAISAGMFATGAALTGLVFKLSEDE